MRISKAINYKGDYENSLIVTIAGRDLWTDTKYTILELGYATYHLCKSAKEEDDKLWILENGEIIPGELSEGRNELKSDGEMLICKNQDLIFQIKAFNQDLTDDTSCTRVKSN